MSANRLTCRELLELVTDYFEGALPPDQRVRFEQHLVMCEGCVIHLEQLRQTIRLTGRLAEDRIDPAARDELLHVFGDWKSGALR